jgi:hypothetical protein
LLYANAATMKKLPANPMRSAAKGDIYSVNVEPADYVICFQMLENSSQWATRRRR